MQGTVLTAPLGLHIVSKTSLTLARGRVGRLGQPCRSLPLPPCWCAPLVPPHRKETVQGKPLSSFWQVQFLMVAWTRKDTQGRFRQLGWWPCRKELDIQPSSSAALGRSEGFTKSPPHLSCYAFWAHILHVYRNTHFLWWPLCVNSVGGTQSTMIPVVHAQLILDETRILKMAPKAYSELRVELSFLAVLTSCSRISSRS